MSIKITFEKKTCAACPRAFIDDVVVSFLFFLSCFPGLPLSPKEYIIMRK